MDKQNIIDYVLETPVNTNPAILGQMIDEIGEGSQSNDLSIAEVTITNNSDYALVFSVANIDENDIYLTSESWQSSVSVLSVILYKNKCTPTISFLTDTTGPLEIVSTGQIEIQSNNIIITGNGSITINNQN